MPCWRRRRRKPGRPGGRRHVGALATRRVAPWGLLSRGLLPCPSRRRAQRRHASAAVECVKNREDCSMAAGRCPRWRLGIVPGFDGRLSWAHRLRITGSRASRRLGSSGVTGDAASTVSPCAGSFWACPFRPVRRCGCSLPPAPRRRCRQASSCDRRCLFWAGALRPSGRGSTGPTATCSRSRSPHRSHHVEDNVAGRLATRDERADPLAPIAITCSGSFWSTPVMTWRRQ